MGKRLDGGTWNQLGRGMCAYGTGCREGMVKVIKGRRKLVGQVSVWEEGSREVEYLKLENPMLVPNKSSGV